MRGIIAIEGGGMRLVRSLYLSSGIGNALWGRGRGDADGELARKQVDLSHQLQQNQQQQQHALGHVQQQEQGTKGYYDPVRNGTVN